MPHPNVLAATVTRKLTELRKREKITLLKLAERLDTTPQNIERIERGQNVTMRTLFRVALALGYEVKITFRRDPHGPKTPPPGRRRTTLKRSTRRP